MKHHRTCLAATSVMFSLAACQAVTFAADPIIVGVAFLDIVTNTVTSDATGQSFLDYQYRRWRLSSPQRFPSESHSIVGEKPLCSKDQNIDDFLHQKCRAYQVVEAKIGCYDKGKNCIAFKLADFLTRDERALATIAAALKNTRTSVTEPKLIDQKYQISDLQTPGLGLTPRAQWIALSLDSMRPYTGTLTQREGGIFIISFKREKDY